MSHEAFYCGVMVSIAGFMSSPFFAVCGATKASLKIFIESVNVELEKSGTQNRILNVSPGFIAGTSFNNGKTDLTTTRPMAPSSSMRQRSTIHTRHIQHRRPRQTTLCAPTTTHTACPQSSQTALTTMVHTNFLRS